MTNSRKNIFACSIIVFMFFFLSGKCQEVLHIVDFSYDDVNQLNVEGDFCNVDITRGEKNGISFEGEISGIARKGIYKIRYTKMDSIVKVWIEKPINFIGIKTGKLKFQVASLKEIKITNTSGRVILEGLNTKMITVKTGSGNINSSNINSDIHLISTSGTVNFLDMSGNIFTRIGNGEQSLRKIKGNVKTFRFPFSHRRRGRRLTLAGGVTGICRKARSSNGQEMLDT